MQVKIVPHKNKDGFYTVVPYDSIDSDTHQVFKAKIQQLLLQGPRMVLLDLSGVDYISSAGLGALFSLKKSLMANKGELLFRNLKPQISKLFEIVKALPKESVFKSIEEADKYFYGVMNEEIRKQSDKPKKK